jgi:uncharacterized RDD family membrane protein YckC
MEFEPAYHRLQLAPLAPRNGAFLIDFLACFMLVQLLQEILGLKGGFLSQALFCLIWLGDRALIAGSTQGQSLGRWAMSLKVVNLNYGKPTGTLDLLKREGLILFFLLVIFNSLDPRGMITSLTIFAPIPLIIDLAFAIADTTKGQALHDKLSDSITIFSKKGLQLDQKLVKFFSFLNRTLKTSQLRNFQATKKQPSPGQTRTKQSGRSKKRNQPNYQADYDNEPTDEYLDISFSEIPRRDRPSRSRRPRRR